MGRYIVLLLLILVGSACTPTHTSGPEFTRIAFGSCADQKLPQPIWAAVRAAKPDRFLFLGDNVYGDVSSGQMAELKRAYAEFAQHPDFTRFRRGTSILATWDDHDYGRNDAGADFPWRAQAEALFLDFWQVPSGDSRRAREGIYFSEMHGPPGRRVQIIMLDTRYFRSPLRASGLRRPKYLPDDNPDKTMLGAAQWSWLAAELQRPAEVRLIVSSIQVTADGHGWERWGNLPRERARLYRLISETRANGVVFLSGDRHLGALYVERSNVPYPLHEATSSSLNRPWRDARESDPRQIGPVYGPENFGTVDIDWRAGKLTLALRNLDGLVVRATEIPLAALQP